ncbi:VWA domain-containing protein [Sinorhizobium sp. RAC02]|uniref:vWA domain-containing protein n=1 Tax=Sinorhizobium sp. RAC02 TaxID=1842534 RepID=UPI0008555D44|nr:VWA domain-containing protein [Sinorhizobium sp. RAC02]AOF91541.1 von Willebrand factor type A domain protein [Sinorhizobium sp. RAC02]
MRLKTVFMLLAGLLAATQTIAADKTMIVLDASGSMWGQIDGRAKIDLARETLGTVLKSVPVGTELGLMVYGHREKGSCSDIELAVPPGAGTEDAINSFVAGLSPKGKTPISHAVEQAADILKYTEDKATVVLVTDGLETCEADPCALASALESKGVDFTTHVVGFGLTEEEGRQVACLAENTGGKYFQASDATQLVAALTETVAEAPMSKPVQEVAVAEPEPAPAIEFNTELDSVLSEGGPSLGDNNDVFWEIYKADANGAPAGDYIESQYKGAFSGNYPPGKYIAVATLQSSIKRQAPFEVKDGAVAKPFVNFDAARLVIMPKRTPEDADADPNAAIEIAFGDYSTTYYGTAKFYASAGEVKLNGSIGPAKVVETLSVKAGETIERDLVIGSGIVLNKAIYAEGGPEVDSGNMFFEVVEATKAIDGSRKSIANSYGTGTKIDVPPGDHVLTAKLGLATGEIPFNLKAGEMKEVVVNINAGVLAITAPGAYSIEILNAKKDIQGNQKSMSTNYGAEYQETLPPGDYVVVVKYEGDVAPKEAKATVKAGERSEVTVQ